MVVTCKFCKKDYASYASRSNHIKRSHTNSHSEHTHNILTITPQILNITPKSNIVVTESNTIVTKNNELKCNYCKKIFTRSDNLKRHYNKCKQKDSNENKLKQENEILKNKVETFEKEIELLKLQMIEIMNKQNKVHPKTLTKINKQLNTLNDNKIINNNINIIALGGESLDTLFNKNQQLDVLSKRYKCLDYLVKQVHFNDKYPQFKNILITNTQNNIAYRYDKNENKFIAIDKNELLDDVITERMCDIETFYDNQLQYLDSKTKDIIHCFIDKMDDKSEKYYEQKMRDIKLVIYNNRDKVSKEITQDLEVIV